jgi:hypothetical protein
MWNQNYFRLKTLLLRPNAYRLLPSFILPRRALACWSQQQRAARSAPHSALFFVRLQLFYFKLRGHPSSTAPLGFRLQDHMELNSSSTLCQSIAPAPNKKLQNGTGRHCQKNSKKHRFTRSSSSIHGFQRLPREESASRRCDACSISATYFPTNT